MSKSELLLAPDNIDTVSTLLLIEINPFYKELKAMTQLDNFNESSLPLPLMPIYTYPHHQSFNGAGGMGGYT